MDQKAVPCRIFRGHDTIGWEYMHQVVNEYEIMMGRHDAFLSCTQKSWVLD